MPLEPKTAPHRRLIRNGTPGIYRRGDRFVAVTSHRGRQVKSTYDTKRDACAARARRMAGPSPSRERFEDYAKRWLAEYRGRTARGLAPSTRDAYSRRARAATTSTASTRTEPWGQNVARLQSVEGAIVGSSFASLRVEACGSDTRRRHRTTGASAEASAAPITYTRMGHVVDVLDDRVVRSPASVR